MQPENERKLQTLTNISQGYKAFIYDCDGTLADNMQAHKDAYVKAASLNGVDLSPELIQELAGWPTLAVVSEINRRYNASLDPVAFATQKSQIFIDEFVEQTLPMDFVVDHLKAHVGKVRIAIASGGSRRTVQNTLRVLGIADLIEVLVCSDDTEKHKPFPDPFLLAARQLGVAPKDCLVFEDGAPGVKAAEAAGMQWVRVDEVGLLS